MKPVEEFEWDDDNLLHCSNEHRLGPVKVDQVRDTRCVFFFNHPDRAATHLMIGPDSSGRFWTVAISPSRAAGLWYDHTGYESSGRERKAYDQWVNRVTGDFGEKEIAQGNEDFEKIFGTPEKPSPSKK
jgi:hypothetical protein